MADTAKTDSVDTQPVERSKLPKPASKSLTPEDFFDYTQRLTKRDLAHVMIYVYRLWPIIQRDPAYIDSLSAPIDRAYLVREHGAGTYRMLLNDTDSKPPTVCQTTVSIDEAEGGEPKIRLDELDVGHRENRKFVERLIRQGRLTPQGEIVQPPQDNAKESIATLSRALVDLATRMAEKPARADRSAEESAIQRALDIIATGGQKSVELVLSQVRQQDPDQFVKLMATVKELLGSGSSSTEKLLELLLKTQNEAQQRLAEAQRQNSELLVKMVEARSGGGLADAIKTITEVLELRERLGGGGGKTHWWQDLAPMVPAALHELNQFVGNLMALRAPQAQWPQPPAPALTPTPPAEASAQPAGTAGSPEMTDMDRMLLRHIAQLAANAFQLGISGDEFADRFAYQYGTANYERLVARPKSEVIETLRRYPEVWALLAPYEQALPQFLDEFYAWGQEDSQAPEADEEPAPRHR